MVACRFLLRNQWRQQCLSFTQLLAQFGDLIDQRALRLEGSALRRKILLQLQPPSAQFLEALCMIDVLFLFKRGALAIAVFDQTHHIFDRRRHAGTRQRDASTCGIKNADSLVRQLASDQIAA